MPDLTDLICNSHALTDILKCAFQSPSPGIRSLVSFFLFYFSFLLVLTFVFIFFTSGLLFTKQSGCRVNFYPPPNPRSPLCRKPATSGILCVSTVLSYICTPSLYTSPDTLSFFPPPRVRPLIPPAASTTAAAGKPAHGSTAKRSRPACGVLSYCSLLFPSHC